jgi:hypothetical protein
MKNYLYGALTLFLLAGCAQKHQINIGDITLQERNVMPKSGLEYYMSFTQEFYDNKLYPLSEYCDDKRAYLSDDKFSTETYLKLSNERTKQSRVGKYPIWFLLNDDASNISCVKKSANFINEEPFVVSDSDNLSVKLLQKNEAEKGVPIRELGVLIDFVSLVVPQTANFLLRTNNIIKDPVTQNYLNMMDEAFKHGDLDGTKSRDFKTNVSAIKVTLNVPEEKEVQELGYILLKPKYRVTLTTVDTPNGIPNFKFIYNSSDHRIEDIMSYQLKGKNILVKTVVDNFRQVSDEHVVEALSLLNSDLMNRFTRYDRALVLSLALRQSDLFKRLKDSVQMNNVEKVKEYMRRLADRENPLHDLSKELKATGCDYYGVMYQAQELLKKADAKERAAITEAERIKEEQLRYQVALEGIENFLRPVSNWNYIPRMVTTDIKIHQTNGKELTFGDLQTMYNRDTNVSAYGCYVDVQRTMRGGVTIQDYLIHPSYTDGVKYNYMALSVNRANDVDVLFYKLSSESTLKIKEILIDKNSQFIMKSRIKDILNRKNPQSCSNDIKRLF